MIGAGAENNLVSVSGASGAEGAYQTNDHSHPQYTWIESWIPEANMIHMTMHHLTIS